MKLNIKIQLCVVLTTVLFIGCRKIPTTSQGDDVLVTTLHDKLATFSNLKTFSISDTIGVVSDNANEKYIADSDASAIIANVVSNLTGRGFVQVDTSANPDVAVVLTLIKNLHVVSYYPGYWYGYGGYYGGYYWGYPGYGYYYPWSYTYAYKTGTFMVEMVDLKNANLNNNTLRVIWSTYVGGYAEGGKNANIINGYINQAFQQSPYLQSY